MLNRLCAVLAQSILSLRYRVRVEGLDRVASRGRRGILFLANHPALIDPPILCSRLVPQFQIHPLAEEEGLKRPGIGFLARRLGTVPVPRMETADPADDRRTQDSLARVSELLRAGENVLLYPAGRIYRCRLENCRGNSAVERILQAVPEARVVLIRTNGLWGSRFSMARGDIPRVRRILLLGLKSLLLQGLFFMPRRRVTLSVSEAEAFPRTGPREQINDTLEHFFNAEAPAALHVPCTHWEGGRRQFADPDRGQTSADSSSVPASIRADVQRFLRQKSGRTEVNDADDLARDLGFDSLAKMEVVSWLNERFGVADAEGAGLTSVADVLLAACGQTSSAARSGLQPVSRVWFQSRVPPSPPAMSPATLPESLLQCVRRHPRQVIAADQTSGCRTYRQLLRDATGLSQAIRLWPEQRIGILLPASVGALTAFFAVLLAEKTPVMLNWTAGRRNLRHALDTAGIQHILSAQTVLKRLERYDPEVAADARRLGVDLKQLANSLTRRQKLLALLYACAPGSRGAARASPSADDPAAILFTSGSETAPKAVPLTHKNLLTNAADIAELLELAPNDRLAGILPPFHSFGLLGTLILPVVLGVPTVYHPNPTQGATVAALIHHYKASFLMGTPTFVAGILRRAKPRQLESLRWIICGAEACPDSVFEQLRAVAPKACILEGYGVTECSPVLALNPPVAPRRQSVGKPMRSLQLAILAEDLQRRVSPGAEGQLLVRGPSVFNGYLKGDAAQAFVHFEQKTWYNTGDRVCRDDDGYLIFRGRSKRFVKVGGEMVSLPAIESVLAAQFLNAADGSPTQAITALETGMRPEIILCTTRADLDRTRINQCLRAAGLSALHTVQRVCYLDSLPLLGSGKIDYRALKCLAQKPSQPSAMPSSPPPQGAE